MLALRNAALDTLWIPESSAMTVRAFARFYRRLVWSGRVEETFNQRVGFARAVDDGCITTGVCNSLPCSVKVGCVSSAFFQRKF